MKKGIIFETAVPVRSESRDSAEMVNQLLFGECYKVLSEKEKWLKIESDHDKYVGWIDRKQHVQLESEHLETTVCIKPTKIRNQVYGAVNIPLAGLVPENSILESFGFEEMSTSKQVVIDVFKACSLFINAPYLWGGRTVYGIDCSGFTQNVFRLIGKSLPRDASEQVHCGETVSFVENASVGDLAFFDNSEEKIIHVGIITNINPIQITHASGRVRVDELDHQGIFNKDTNQYSHKLRIIKTIT